MDILIIGGLSKAKGSQFSIKKGLHLVRDDKIMSVPNLQRYFGLPLDEESLPGEVPYLAGINLYNYLTQNGIDCGLINFLDKETEIFDEYIQKKPKLIALSTTFFTNVESVCGVTKMIKEAAPDVPIIVGGPLVYNSYLLYSMKNTEYDIASCAEDYFFIGERDGGSLDIDFFVIDEQGENTLLSVVNFIKEGLDPRSLPNLAYYSNGDLFINQRSIENNSFEHDFLDLKVFPERLLSPIFPVRGSRGCPHSCTYCNFFQGRRFRLKSAELLAKEVAALIDTGRVKMIRFTDDNLFLTRRHVKAYCDKLLEAGRSFKWTSFMRASSITRENVRLLKDTGCVLAQIGMETGSPRLLQRMNKQDTPEHYLEVVDLLNANGISTQLYFIVGFPGETEQTIQQTIDLINQFSHAGPAINTVMVFPFLLAPLSPIFAPDKRKAYNLRGYMADWSHDTMSFPEAYHHAQSFFQKLENVHPFYGIEEYLVTDAEQLKSVARQRTALRQAELRGESRAVVDAQMLKLQNIIAGEPGGVAL